MSLFVDLSVIALFSLIGSLLALRIKQPPVLGVLIAGAIAGPYALGLLGDAHLLEALIEWGAFLLLFLIGLEFNLPHLLQSGIRVFLIALVKLSAVFFAAYTVSLLLGLDAFTALFIGAILSITSTVIFLKILEQKGLHKRKEVPTLIGVLILEDIFGVFALTFFSSFETAADITPLSILGRLLFALAILGIVYLFVQRRINKAVDLITAQNNPEVIMLLSFGILLGMGMISLLLGLSISVGAFLAGNIIASLRNAQAFEKPMQPFILTSTSLFFFAIGATVDFSVLKEWWLLILLLFALNVLAKIVAIGFSMYLFTSADGKGAVFSGISMVTVGEFSLLLAAESRDLITLDLVSITAIIIFLSSISMSLFVTREKAIYSLLVSLIPKRTRLDFDAAAAFSKSVAVRMSESRLRRFEVEWRTIANNVIGLALVGALAWFWYRATGFTYLERLFDFFVDTPLGNGVLFLLIVVLFFPTFSIIRNIRHFFLDFTKSVIATYPKEIANSKKLTRNILLIVCLFLLSILIPPIFAIIGLPVIWSAISIPLLIITALLFLNSESLAKEMREHHHSHDGGHYHHSAHDHKNK